MLTEGQERSAQALRQMYLTLNMPGMADLIDYIVEEERAGRHLECVGSSAIDLNGVMNEILVTEEARFEAVWFRTFKLHFGKPGVHPIVDIGMCGPTFELMPPEARKKVDDICRMFAAIGRAEPAGDVEVIDRTGIYRIPKEEYLKGRRDPSYVPQRIKIDRLSIDGPPRTKTKLDS